MSREKAINIGHFAHAFYFIFFYFMLNCRVYGVLRDSQNRFIGERFLVVKFQEPRARKEIFVFCDFWGAIMMIK